MTDFQGAVEQAIFDQLCGRVTKGKVFQHVPDATSPPVVIIADVDWEDEGDKDAPLLLFSVTITSIIAGRSRKPLNALQTQVRTALDRWKPANTAAVAFGEASVGSGTGQEVQAPSGPVWFGSQTVRLYAQGI